MRLACFFIDETGLTGTYDIRVQWERLDQAGLFQRLHEELGLMVTPGQRAAPLLVGRGE